MKKTALHFHIRDHKSYTNFLPFWRNIKLKIEEIKFLVPSFQQHHKVMNTKKGYTFGLVTRKNEHTWDIIMQFHKFHVVSEVFRAFLCFFQKPIFKEDEKNILKIMRVSWTLATTVHVQGMDYKHKNLLLTTFTSFLRSFF